MEKDLYFLRNLGMDNCTNDQLYMLHRQFDKKVYMMYEHVFKQTETAHSIYLILEGEV